MLSDQISYSKVSDFTDTSSIMRNVNVNGTEKKKRTLSIAPSKTSDMSPGKIGGDYTIDVQTQSHRSLNKEALKSLAENTPNVKKE